MKLHYYHPPGGNFGDDLNSWIWPTLLPKRVEDCFDDDTLLLGIGTILNDKVPATPPKKLVFGSGYGYGALPQITDQWKFYCLRGPLTAKALGLPLDLAITDGAILIRELLKPDREDKFRAALIPHHWNAFNDDWKNVCDSLSIAYIDPRRSVHEVVQDICNSSLVITEAMHGAIIADTYRIPWIPIRTRKYINDFKWQDWCASIGLNHKFEWLPPIWSAKSQNPIKRNLHGLLVPIAQTRLRWLIKYGKRRLSTTTTFQTVYQRLIDKLHDLVNDANKPFTAG